MANFLYKLDGTPRTLRVLVLVSVSCGGVRHGFHATWITCLCFNVAFFLEIVKLNEKKINSLLELRRHKCITCNSLHNNTDSRRYPSLSKMRTVFIGDRQCERYC